MCDHHAGEIVFADDFFGQFKNLFCCCRVKRSCVLIKEEELRRIYRCHEERKCLPLPAGKQTDGLMHSVLKPHVQQRKPFLKVFSIPLGDVAKPASAVGSEGKVFFNAHSGCTSAHRILKKPANRF